MCNITCTLANEDPNIVNYFFTRRIPGAFRLGKRHVRREHAAQEHWPDKMTAEEKEGRRRVAVRGEGECIKIHVHPPPLWLFPWYRQLSICVLTGGSAQAISA